MIEAQQCKWVRAIEPVVIKDNASWTCQAVDCQSWDYAEVAVQLGATDIAISAMTMTESDDDSTWVDITAGVWGTAANSVGTTSTLPSATNDNKIFVFQIDLTKRRRYLKLTLTAGNGTAGTYACAIARLSRGEIGPNTAAEQGCQEILRF